MPCFQEVVPKIEIKHKASGGRYKSNGGSKSQGKYLRKCWKCSKDGNYKKYCRSNNVEKENGSKDTPSIDAKTSS